MVSAHDGHHAPASGGESGQSGAIAFLQARVAANPSDLPSLSRLGGMLLEEARRSGRHEDYVEAADAFRALVAQDETSQVGPIGLAYGLLGQHRFAEALDVARPVIERDRFSGQSLALLGDLHFALGNYVEAEWAYERLAAGDLNVQSLSRLAHIRELRGEHEAASRMMQDALTASQLLEQPGNVQAWCLTMLGEQALGHGKLEEARERFEAAVAVDADAHQAWGRLAEVERLQGHLDRAEGILASLAAEHDLTLYWVGLGRVHLAAGRKEDAATCFGRVEDRILAEVGRGDVGHLRELAELWLSLDRRLDKAVAFASRDLREVRRDVGAYETLGWALFKVGRYEEAWEQMRTAIAPGASSARLMWRASRVAEATGRRRIASAMRDQALAMNPLIEQLEAGSGSVGEERVADGAVAAGAMAGE